MPEDKTLQAVFDHAKQGIIDSQEHNLIANVFAKFLEHFPNSHPPGSTKSSADLVTYANGQMTLSQNKKILSGEFKLWRNIFDPAPFLVGAADAFDDANSQLTVVISVSDSGQVTHQRKIKGQPIGGMPPALMNAIYENGLFVEKTIGAVRSLSFTLEYTP